MTKEYKVKVLAELDDKVCDNCGLVNCGCSLGGYGSGTPLYLSSYDAIICLIQKQPRHILTQIVLSMKGQNDVSRMVDWLMFSPEELADILIKVIKVDKAEAIR